MFFKKMLCFIYPSNCVFCGKNTKNDSYTCENCLSILQYYRVHEISSFYKQHYYDKAWALYTYEGFIKTQLLNYKFHGQRYLNHFFATMILQKINRININVDVILPVPISRQRLFQRGYNQSADIVNQIAKKMKLNNPKGVLVKTKNNVKQSVLPHDIRVNNVKGVYKVKRASFIQKKNVLLIDDIYTTGATVNECSKVLKQAGASSVFVLTIAYAKKKGKD